MDTSIKQKQSTFDYHQLLLSWFSPSFPIGSFNFSHGLEAAIEYKFVCDKITLEEWIKHPLEKLLIAFLQSFVSNLINVGIKHIPLGQSDGQKILINLLPVIEKQANINKIAQINNLGSSAFLSDLSSMYHETLNNRIYQT